MSAPEIADGLQPLFQSLDDDARELFAWRWIDRCVRGELSGLLERAGHGVLRTLPVIDGAALFVRAGAVVHGLCSAPLVDDELAAVLCVHVHLVELTRQLDLRELCFRVAMVSRFRYGDDRLADE